MTTETYSTTGPECPYCGRQYHADDAGYYDESSYTEETCDNCEKTFGVSVYHSVSWTCSARDDDAPNPSQHTPENHHDR